MTDAELRLKRKLRQLQILLIAQKLQYSPLRIALLVTLLTSLGVLGRAALQFIPSVEPLTAIAVLNGFFFGPLAGFVSGASGFYASNYLVWGGQGPWTVFQMLGAGLAGFIGGVFGFGKKSRWKVLAATSIGLLFYELIVTIGLSAIVSFNPAFIALYLLTSLPFSVVHMASSVGFSITLYEFKEQIKKLKGGKIIEQEILGIRTADSDSSGHSDKLVPFFYSRKTFGKDNSKSRSRFWPGKHDEDDNDE
ncbi:MAG: ECF transporter S component [Candidatus Aenigmarchaeota archaeon]|nr:ECF transporter S component [Candidatus Aenigmarchaeota archaeon]